RPPCSPLFPYTTLFRSALALGILMTVTLSGCRPGPDITVAGSYFPSWMASLVVGVLGTILFWRLFMRLGIDPYLGPRALVYVARSEEHTSELQSRGHLV